MSEEVMKRSKKSPCFTLERIVDVSDLSKELADSMPEKFVILEVENGFISPEKALEYAGEKKIKGTLRVVRVASGLFEGEVVNPEPVYSLKKLAPEPEKKAGKKPRKQRVSKANDSYPVAPPVDNAHVAPGCEQFSTDKAQTKVLSRVLVASEEVPKEGVYQDAIPPDDEGMNPEGVE